MSLFDRLVAEALRNQGELASLQVVVEKELLHHDILREMSAAGLLKNLTFIGGTCLRSCYGSDRLSEDLDFTGGNNFDRRTLAVLGKILVKRLRAKYDLQVVVSEPVRETTNVATWKLKVTTRPQQVNRPVQRIHIDICTVPSYDRQPMMLRNHYGVDMGTSGLIIQAQSREEILADKMVAFALRPNRIMNRDLWDIGWLKRQNILLPFELVAKKVVDRRRKVEEYLGMLEERMLQLENSTGVRKGFVAEMRRFLPPQVVRETVDKEEFWTYLTGLITAECKQIVLNLSDHQGTGFSPHIR